MKEIDIGLAWMYGVMGVMLIFGLIAVYGIHRNK